FNQNFVLRRADIPGRLTEAAVLHDPASGRTLTVLTTEPGLFLYTANFRHEPPDERRGDLSAARRRRPRDRAFPRFPESAALPDDNADAGGRLHEPYRIRLL